MSDLYARINTDIIQIGEAPIPMEEFRTKYIEKGDHDVFMDETIMKMMLDIEAEIAKGQTNALSGEESDSLKKAVEFGKKLSRVLVIDEAGIEHNLFVKAKDAEEVNDNDDDEDEDDEKKKKKKDKEKEGDENNENDDEGNEGK